MWLENHQAFGLIAPFKRVNMPSLAVIIGVNGAGKSQLLNGISTGKIRTSLNITSDGMLTHFNENDFVLLTNADEDPKGLVTERTSNLSSILQAPVRASHAATVIKEVILQQGKERYELDRELVRVTGKSINEHGLNWSSFANLVTGLSPQYPPPVNIPDRERFLSLAQAAGTRLQYIMNKLSGISRSANAPGPVPIVAHPAHLLAFNREQFLSHTSWAESALFTPDLVNIFLEYRDRRWRNNVQRQSDLDDGTSLAHTREEFLSNYGPPPWDKVSDALLSFGLPYSVAPVPTDPAQPVKFRLIRNDTKHDLGYNELSSGERVLLRMVLASFQADDERINVRSPRLMLLDELDASLHPENVHRWLTAIQQGYVDELGISCILTTHSPTTVALAPEGSIFEMTPDDPRPVPISKQHAIDRLTSGLPMLSIDYSARRQVFVESTTDVTHYSMVYDVMRPRLRLDRTLSFVGTGTKGGCVFVYDMVGHMEENGNRAVFGVVDWDTENLPRGHVRVLAGGTHYAKENVFLDPLLVGALRLKNDTLKLDPPVRYSELRNADPATLQRLSNAISNNIKFPAAASRDARTNYYVSGLELSVPSAYQTWNGHDLEKAIKTAFPDLGGRYSADGALITAVIQRVLEDYPELCPKPLADIYTELANGDA